MAGPALALEGRVRLTNVSWESYERMLAENVNNVSERFAFDGGRLEITVVSAKHESLNRILAQIVEVASEEREIDVWSLGSATLRRSDLLKGVEPDSSFYFKKASVVRAKDNIDMMTDPPPELVIEVDVTSNSLSRFGIYSGLGVDEVWRYAEGEVCFYKLGGGVYEEISASAALPFLNATAVTQWVRDSREMPKSAWIRQIRSALRQSN